MILWSIQGLQSIKLNEYSLIILQAYVKEMSSLACENNPLVLVKKWWKYMQDETSYCVRTILFMLKGFDL